MASARYHILWPGGNTTALVESAFGRHNYARVAKQILDHNKIIEQVGFVEAPTRPMVDVRLHMMGGEFCGNAARSVAYWFAHKHGKKEVNLEVSGFDSAMRATIEKEKSHLYLPSPFVLNLKKKDDFRIVDLAGIRHVVVRESANKFDYESIINDYKEGQDAVGVIYIMDDAAQKVATRPIVWVRGTNTCYHETACGSGSIAVGVVLYNQYGSPRWLVRQPSGEDFEVEMLDPNNGSFSGIRLSGKTLNQGVHEIPVNIQ